MNREDVDNYADSTEQPLLVADGFDDAIIGIAQRKGSQDCVAYDYSKCVETLVDRDGMTHEEAVEYLDFNTLGAYVGEHTPCFIMTEGGY